MSARSLTPLATSLGTMIFSSSAALPLTAKPRTATASAQAPARRYCLFMKNVLLRDEGPTARGSFDVLVAGGANPLQLERRRLHRLGIAPVKRIEEVTRPRLEIGVVLL